MRFDRVAPLVLLGIALMPIALRGAQTATPTFQLVSIARAEPVESIAVLDVNKGATPLKFLPDGRFEARDVSLVDLARVAFGFESLNPTDGVVRTSAGRWSERVRYDIVAVSDRPWTQPPVGERIPAELRQKLQSLLADRFALAASIEHRRVPAYVLRTSRSSSPGRLRPSGATCVGPYAKALPAEPLMRQCSLRLESDRIEAEAVTMPEFVRLLGTMGWRLSDRQVVDGTGLAGRFDIALTIPRSSSDRVDYVKDLRAALHAQLGLELQSAKLTLPTLHITSARRPDED
jgi:uncharacterized protein (TIGR03435 family)